MFFVALKECVVWSVVASRLAQVRIDDVCTERHRKVEVMWSDWPEVMTSSVSQNYRDKPLKSTSLISF